MAHFSIAARYIHKKKYLVFTRAAFPIGFFVAFFSSYAQLYIGHLSANVVAEHQTAKLAALEGHFPASGKADRHLFGWVDKEKLEVKGLAIPGGLCFLVNYKFSEPIKGLMHFLNLTGPKT
ncbi:cytochrome ubiquinol oxidase subunit I [Flavihumibacter solisilvae]|uniref:Uncharacterized protein n=1 Tax=Flavihumibacter solisilvae TaxID=1349421 RepID=A0A0C1IQP4_9BACT|nr:cytochrome ubiquinol oxidase subunit I [Flavihumibacter solisilvae]KIC96500.1 hypothetical protein OI18_01880 [Flavihumibacter solisilvae]